MCLLKILLVLRLLTLSASAIQEEQKGNWEGTFQLNNKTEAVHTPSYIKVGHRGAVTRLTFHKGVLLDSFKLENDLDLYVKSTKEEFISALEKSGLYNRSKATISKVSK